MAEAPPIKNFNMQHYMFEVTLLPYNKEPVPLNPDAIFQLVLEEDLFRWYKRGFIVFQNSFEMFERSMTKKASMGVFNAADIRDNNYEGYIFRNDGKDRISIKIKPIIIKETESQFKDIPDEKWMINFIGNIYDFEEPLVQEFGEKIKKIYFWQEEFQKMVERDLIWSTATSKLNENIKIEKKSPQNADDNSRKLNTGIAIKDILKNEMKFEIDEENFDSGSTRIFHTAPNGSNVWDNISYLLENHYSSVALQSQNNDISIFLYDDEKKKFKLIPLTKIFDKAGKEVNTPKEYQIEHFLLEDYGNKEEANKLWMAPVLDQYHDSIDVKITKLRKYSFTDMAGIDSIRDMITTAVHTYDRKNKTFTKSVENSIIEKIPQNLIEDYIEPYFLTKTPETLINLNNIKKQNKKVKSIFTPYANKSHVERKGHGGMIFKSIFLNLCLLIETEGSTNRKIARFVGVDRMSNSETEFDFKLGGQWFVVGVKHNFFRNSYANEILCVKPHVFDKISVEENID